MTSKAAVKSTYGEGRGQSLADRPLTEEERAFSAEPQNYNRLFTYMRTHKLDAEEWYDILIIPYLNAVKQYCSKPELRQQYRFSTILTNTLESARKNHYRDMNRMKRKPEGGLYSLDYICENEESESGRSVSEWIADQKAMDENDIIFNMLFRKFYRECVRSWEKEKDGASEEYLGFELDLLLDGYSPYYVDRMAKQTYGGNGYRIYRDTARNIREFQKIFYRFFGTEFKHGRKGTRRNRYYDNI